jgi:hypothetical protein
MMAEMVVFTSDIRRFWNTMPVARPWQPGPVVALARVLIRTPRVVRVKVLSRTVTLVRNARLTACVSRHPSL